VASNGEQNTSLSISFLICQSLTVTQMLDKMKRLKLQMGNIFHQLRGFIRAELEVPLYLHFIFTLHNPYSLFSILIQYSGPLFTIQYSYSIFRTPIQYSGPIFNILIQYSGPIFHIHLIFSIHI
jgi:hypothetical protein